MKTMESAKGPNLARAAERSSSWVSTAETTSAGVPALRREAPRRPRSVPGEVRSPKERRMSQPGEVSTGASALFTRPIVPRGRGGGREAARAVRSGLNAPPGLALGLPECQGRA